MITQQCNNISLTQSAVTQAAEKLCARNGPATTAYEGLKEEIRQSPVVNTDDTGWAIGVTLAFVMGFFTKLVKFYAICRQHRSDEVIEILGQGFQGLMGCDRGSSYDAHKMDHIRQQKCLSHLLKNIKEAMRDKTGKVLEFGDQLSALLREGIQLWHDLKAKKLSRRAFNLQGADLDERLRAHLRHQNLADADAQRILDGIGLRHDNDQVLLFLKKPEIEPTNNMAERDLRGAVISRKNSQCSKNDRGADTFAKLKSIFETLRARKLQVIEGFKQVILTGKVPAFEG